MKFELPARLARRIPDPVFHQEFGSERYLLYVEVDELPQDIPLDPNAHTPNVRKRVYKDVLKSLFNEDCTEGTFHLKNKGITILADSVKRVEGESGDDDVYVVSLKNGHGIVDGGHTYELIIGGQAKVPDEWITDIAGGLNTSVQVQDMSLDNLSGSFDWIKEELANESYLDAIAWSENEAGPFDARDIVSMLYCFNIALYPNDEDDQPVASYEKKSLALKAFEEEPETFEKLRPLLKQILVLHDTIRLEAREIWNKSQPGSKGAKLAFIDKKKTGEYEFPFIDQTSDCRLMNGALYPMLAAFRWMVEVDPKSKKFRWRGGFKAVLKAWRDISPELLKMTYSSSSELGRNPNAIGKSRNHWANLYTRVAMRDLQAKTAAN